VVAAGLVLVCGCLLSVSCRYVVAVVDFVLLHGGGGGGCRFRSFMWYDSALIVCVHYTYNPNCVVKNFSYICGICFAWLSQDILVIKTNTAVLLYTRVCE
jgi:hypothetical protein